MPAENWGAAGALKMKLRPGSCVLSEFWGGVGGAESFLSLSLWSSVIMIALVTCCPKTWP